MRRHAALLTTADAFLITVMKNSVATFAFIVDPSDLEFRQLRMVCSCGCKDGRGARWIRGTMSYLVTKCTKLVDHFSLLRAWEKMKLPTRGDPNVIHVGVKLVYGFESGFLCCSNSQMVARMAIGPPAEWPLPENSLESPKKCGIDDGIIIDADAPDGRKQLSIDFGFSERRIGSREPGFR
uniref:Uncharacterized protein n=1 Tax=Cucumis melo TaxID=3656 RepID=A0A9I9E7A1_CUCME